MTHEQLEALISKYEAENKVSISYGGDGTILDVIQKTAGKRPIIPVRNYSCCEQHKDFLKDLLEGRLQKTLKLTRCSFIEWKSRSFSGKGIAEVSIKNCDPTSALRFDLSINGKTYFRNVISDGIVASTPYGSTGYFKSIARMIFSCDGIGVAFIAPTQGINNLVIDSKSVIEAYVTRSTNVLVSADKTTKKINLCAGDKISIQKTAEAVSLLGLDEFHCQKCRALRHSTYEDGLEVQDIYSK